MKAFLSGACSLLLVLSFATGASAQATRTWVSGVGDDVNPCSRTAPCKTFAGAISKTATNGEINALDSGGFGAVTITKSITIDGGHYVAGILAAGTNGVNVSGAGAVVTLRRIQINGAGTGLIGVNVILASQVNIEDVEIFGFRGSPGHGVSVAGTNATNVQIHNSRIENNLGTGVLVGAGNTTIVGSSLVGNGFAGVSANGVTLPPFVLVSNSNLSMNGRGIHTGGSGKVRMTHLDIFFNTVFAWEVAGGEIQTHVDNRILGAGSGALTPVVY